MKILKLFVLTLIFVLALNLNLAAANTATQDVTVDVQAINELAVTGSPSIVINADTAGVSAGDSNFEVADTSSYISFTTNEASKKITAALDAAFSGITLEVTVATDGGSSSGLVTLSAADANVLSLGNLAESDNTITYTASCDINKTPASEMHTVTFTLTDG